MLVPEPLSWDDTSSLSEAASISCVSAQDILGSMANQRPPFNQHIVCTLSTIYMYRPYVLSLLLY